ncbi:CPBP family intramembrane glutamic endopeptidase [Halalkalirubrum salinum]|uniref:CPBP family intramembrane glutamic endopeptidase n=1 Tax=Halalkalirubrum salinum TaxID=2563889 RepID=UPI0010FB1993|nr:CPBP family intramembrane glutamic endopeptidase [Halalkalirubrum salinum]
MADSSDADIQVWMRRGSALFEGVFVVLAALVAASLAVAVIREPLVAATGGTPDATIVQLSVTVIQFVFFGLVVFWYLRVTDRWKMVGFDEFEPTHAIAIAVGTAVLLGGQLGISALFSSLGISTGANRAITDGLGNPEYFFGMIIISLLLVGPAEELLFRGVLQARLRESWGAWPAIVLATIVFGAIHLPAIIGEPTQQYATLVVIALLGLVLGYLYERTRTIWVPAIVHGANNAVIFAIQYAGAIGLL